MLKWFADRLAETGKDARKDERGFTLIELLVVVIIIGILAAIAIPAFLSQRDNAEEARIKSDARNLVSVYTGQNADTGSFPAAVTDETGAVGSGDFQFTPSDDVQVTTTVPTGGGFTACAENTGTATFSFKFDSSTGKYTEGTGC